MNQYIKSTIRALISIVLGVFIWGAANGDSSLADLTKDLTLHWVAFTGAIAAPALLALENIILGDIKLNG
jgi:hypothetical protein